MVELRTKLTDDERDMVNKLSGRLGTLARADKLNDAYYEGAQRLRHIGLAVPEEFRIFELVANWPRMYIDELSRRQKPKSIYRPGADRADPVLQEAFDANNLAAEVPILAKENMIFGRMFTVVGTNEDDPEHPLITVESPRQMACLVNQRRRRMDAALRRYQEQDGTQVATLFLPAKTIQLVQSRDGWDIDIVGSDSGVDEHGLGRVPVVLFLNRRRLGKWHGTTEMADIIPLTDACARTLTDLQYGVETVAVQKRYVLGISKGDFVDKDGNPQPVWKSYLDALWATQKSAKDVAIGQLPGADLSNFHNTVKMYAELASSVTGLPFRYFGANTANPAAEGAIRADESRIVSNAEEKNAHLGVGLGWTLAIYERFRTGEWPAAGEPIAVEWRNPATPTKAEEADAIQKLNGGTAVLSREGSWDEMGWDEHRKARERGHFESEAENSPLAQLNRGLNAVPTNQNAANANGAAPANVG
ncbi:phage portal protein [Nocardia sp. CDC159]|uniref:Phage portal protein n=1 Tax=Nocardia pulmonis TaxID=2951408 RepID=A0A9X2ECX2_9NOCA|nr:MULTISPECIES: phage portal protein [Nocardia]MCM6778041.1 phage portal protein [Nocardia pulmonis]MCM6790788.1 phage portal protein [Nocardia sp. CDC159]